MELCTADVVSVAAAAAEATEPMVVDLAKTAVSEPKAEEEAEDDFKEAVSEAEDGIKEAVSEPQAEEGGIQDAVSEPQAEEEACRISEYYLVLIVASMGCLYRSTNLESK
jgi:hypothetical protein